MHTIEHIVLTRLRLDTTGVPIYVQLRDQLLRLIGEGLLAPGARMPTMRQVAVALKIDLNTVRRAYDELERTGAIALIRGRGSFVTAAAAPADPAVLAAATDALAAQVTALAAAAGVDPLSLCERIAHLAHQKEPDPWPR